MDNRKILVTVATGALIGTAAAAVIAGRSSKTVRSGKKQASRMLGEVSHALGLAGKALK